MDGIWINEHIRLQSPMLCTYETPHPPLAGYLPTWTARQ